MGKYLKDLPPSPEVEITDDTLIAVSFEGTIKTYKSSVAEILMHLSTVSFTDKGEIPAQGTITSVPLASDTCHVSLEDYDDILIGSILYVGSDEAIVIDKYTALPNYVLKINGVRSYASANYSYRLPYATFFKQSGELVGIVNANGTNFNKLGSITDENDYIAFESGGVITHSDSLIQQSVGSSTTRFELNPTSIVAVANGSSFELDQTSIVSAVSGGSIELNPTEIVSSATDKIDSYTSGNLANSIDKSGIIVSPLQSGIYYRLSRTQTIQDDIPTVLDFDERVYDIQNEFDITSHIFRPTLAGMYSVSVTIALGSGWSVNDEIDLFVVKSPSVTDAIGAHTKAFAATPARSCFLSVYTIVQVDAYPAGDIRPMVVGNFLAASKMISVSESINSGYRGYSGVQISKIA